MKRALFVVAAVCALAVGSTGAVPFAVNKMQLFGTYLQRDASCPQATHVLVHICQSGTYPRAYVRLKKNEDVSSLENHQLEMVNGLVSKVQNSCPLPILESPKLRLLTDSVYDCFD